MQTFNRRGNPFSRLAVALAFALLFAVLAASSALAAVWLPAVDLSATEENSFQPQVAVGPDGTATAVWVLYDGSNFVIQARRIAADGTPAASTHNLIVSPQFALEPHVALSSDGSATVAWIGTDGSNQIIQERRIAPDGTPSGPVNDLSAGGGNAEQPQVAVGPDGTATVVWRRNDGSNIIVQERRIAPGGTPDAATNDLSATGGDANEPQVAVGPDGTATVVWRRNDGSNEIVQERRIAPDGTPDASTNDLSAAGGDANEPQVAVGPDGTATVVWRRNDGTDEIVQERRIAPGGTPEATTDDLSAGGGAFVDDPQVAVGPPGSAFVVWVREGSTSIIVQERRIAPDGTPDPGINDLSTSAGFLPQVAVGPDGTAAVVWNHADGIIGGGLFTNQVVQARRVAADGTPAATSNLSAPAAFIEEQTLGAPQVAIGPSGIATAVWTRYPSNFIVQASTFTEPAPPVSNSFSIGKNRRNKKRGTVTLPVNVPGPGTLTLRGKGLIKRRPALGRPGSHLTSRTVGAAGTVKLVVKARAGTKVRLNNTGKAKVAPTVTYTPTGGAANSKSRSLTLRKKLRPSRAGRD